jgi:hypothetical protein
LAARVHVNSEITVTECPRNRAAERGKQQLFDGHAQTGLRAVKLRRQRARQRGGEGREVVWAWSSGNLVVKYSQSSDR